MAAGVGDRLIPRTSDRFIADFTSDEKRALYDYVIANTVKPDIGDDIADMNKTKQNDGDVPRMSFLELLAQERNLKRRRAKHRGVHTNKKSQLEILREVINQQMEMYVEYITDSSIKQESQSPGRSEVNSMDHCSNDFYNSHQPSGSDRNRINLSKGPSTSDVNRFDRDRNRDRDLFRPVKQEPVSPELDSRFQSSGTSRKHETESPWIESTTDRNFSDRERIREKHRSRDRERRSRHRGRKRDGSTERIPKKEPSERRRSKDRKTHDKDKHRSRDKYGSRKRHKSRDRDRSKNRKHKKYDDHYRDTKISDKSRNRNRDDSNDYEHYEY